MITPNFVGQTYTDNLTGDIWKANSLTEGDWTLQVQNSKMKWEPTDLCVTDRTEFSLIENNGLTSVTFEGTTSGGINVEVDFTLESITSSTLLTVDQKVNAAIVIDNCDVLSIVSLSALTEVTDQISISNAPLLATIAFPALTTVPLITLDTLPALTALDLGGALTISGTLTITACDILSSIDLGTFISAGIIVIQSNPALTSLTLTAWVPPNGSDNSFSDNALDVTTVNHILSRAVANAGFVTGIINLTGGTNAAPAGQGATDVTTLQGRGVTVTHN